MVFFGILIGVFALGSSGPFVGTISMARAAAYEVYRIIDRVKIENNLKFKNIPLSRASDPKMFRTPTSLVCVPLKSLIFDIFTSNFRF